MELEKDLRGLGAWRACSVHLSESPQEEAVIRTVTVSADVIGVDFIEVIPMLDDACGTTRLLVSRLIRETLEGIRVPFYHAPETDSMTARKRLTERWR